MSQANPFEPLPSMAMNPGLREWPALPRQFAWVAALVWLIGIASTLVTWSLYDDLDYADLLRQMAPFWLGHLLLSTLAAYWATSIYLERQGLAGYPQPALLMLAYGLAWLVASWALGYALSFLYMWLYEKTGSNGAGRLLSDALWWLVGLVRFAVEALLTLWLVLHLFRRKARPAEAALRVSATTLAWCFALGLVVISLQLNALVVRLFGGMLTSELADGWSLLSALVSTGLFMLVAFFAARSALPVQVRGFNGGRLALACLITFALWFGSAVPGAIIVLATLWFGFAGSLVLLGLFAVLQLALLWPFTRLGLRWGYRAQAA